MNCAHGGLSRMPTGEDAGCQRIHDVASRRPTRGSRLILRVGGAEVG